MILDIYSTSGNDLRWRIEHSQVVQESDLTVMENLISYHQYRQLNAISDMSWAEQRLGDRVKNAYACASDCLSKQLDSKW